MESLLTTPESRLRQYMEYENGYWYTKNPYALSLDSVFVEKLHFVSGRLFVTNNSGIVTEHSIHEQRRLSVWKVELVA